MMGNFTSRAEDDVFPQKYGGFRKIIPIAIILSLFLVGPKVFGQYMDSIPQICNNTTGGIEVISHQMTPIGATGSGTLKIDYFGDLGTTSEIIEIFSEGGSLLYTLNGSGSDCAISGPESITIPMDSINAWAADGQISFTYDAASGVNSGVCTGPSAFCLTPVLSYPFAYGTNNIGVSSVDIPATFCNPTQNILATIQNSGTNQVDTFSVGYSINGVAQPSQTFYTLLDSGSGSGSSTTQVNLGTHTFNGLDTIVVWTFNPNNLNDTVNTNDTITYINGNGLNGTYSIGPIGNFQSFSEAISHLNLLGLCGPVIFNVSGDVYNEQVILGEISGASSINTITFNGAGVGNTVLQHAATGSSDQITLQLDGADHTIWKNMTIAGLNPSNAFAIHLSNQANFNTFDSIAVIVEPVASTSNVAGIVASSSTTSATSSGDNANNTTISNSTVSGGYYGITFRGNGTTTPNDNNNIYNTNISDYYYYGIYYYYQNLFQLHDNYVEFGTGGSSFGNALYTGYASQYDIRRNYLRGADDGMYMFNTTYNNTLTSYIVNNMVMSGGDAAMYIDDGDNLNIWHNTTYSESNYGIEFNSTDGNVNVRNNIFTSGSNYALFSDNQNQTLDYNLYYRYDGGSIADHQNVYTDIVAWQVGCSCNANSLQGNPYFVSFTDLHSNGPIQHAAADPSVGVTLDIDGQSRPIPSGTNPDMGADEYLANSNDAATVDVFTLPGGNIVVEVLNFGSSPLTSVDVYAAVDDGSAVTVLGPVSPASTIAPGLTDTVTVGYYPLVQGMMYQVTAWTANPNNLPDGDTSNDTLSYFICTPMSGTYTVNSSSPTLGTNFNSLADAANALSTCGVVGPVTINIAAGTYNEQVVLGTISGVSATNTVTFNGAGVGSTILQHNAAGSSDAITLQLNGADHTIWKNMTIAGLNPSNAFAIHLSNQADFNTFDSIAVIVEPVASTSNVAGIVASSSTTSASSSGNNANNTTISNSTVSGGYYGIILYGNGTTTPTDNNVVLNTTITDFYYYGLYLYYQNQFQLHDNYVEFGAGGTSFGMALYTAYASQYDIRRNYFRGADDGMYMFNTTYNNTLTSHIVNNMIVSGGDAAMYIDDGDNLNIWHNTTYSNSNYGIEFNSTDANVDVRNNIFTSGSNYALFSDGTNMTLDYNLYYRFDNGTLVDHQTTYADLVAWQTACSCNLNSVEGDPIFTSFTDLHVKGLLPNNAGDNSVGVTIDYDGQTRPLPPSTTVDIGADEFTPPAIEVSLTTFLAPMSGCGDSNTVVSVIVTNYGTSTASNIPVSVDITGPSNTTLTGILPGPLATYESDTLIVGTFNTFNGGVFSLTGYTELTGDEDLSNDTAFSNVTITPVPVASSSFGSVCVDAGTSVTIIANDTTFDYNWYNSANVLVGTGDTFISAPISSDEQFYAEAIAGTGTFLFTELADDASAGDLLELQNVSNQPIDVTGWTIAISESGATTLNSTQTLSGIVNPGGIIYFDDNSSSGASYWGANIPWGGTSGYWAMLIDDQGNIVDFAAADFTAADIAAINVTVNGFPITIGNEWSGPGFVSSGSSTNIIINTSDNNNASDWMEAATETPGTANAGLNLPAICTGPLMLMGTVNINPMPTITPEPDACLAEPARTLQVDVAGGTWSGPGITDPVAGTFDPGTAGVGAHEIIYTVTGANGCVGADTITINVTLSPDATISGPYEVCVDAGVITFTAPSTGGTWSGTGITDPVAGTFDPSLAGVGSFILTYDIDLVGCQDIDTHMITVRPLPDASFGQMGPYCSNDAPVTFNPVVSGGTFSGTGVVGNSFDPALAGPGFHQIIYDVTNAFGCMNSDTITIEVRLQPDATITGPSTLCFNDAAVQYSVPTQGGVWTGNGLNATGMFDPAVAGLGMHMLTYTFFNNGCNDTDTFYVTVHNVPAVSITAAGPVCENAASIQLTSNISGGVWTGVGVDASGMFDPAVAGVGTHTVTYEVTNANGCIGTATRDITVISAPTVSVTAAGPYCTNDNAVALSGSPSGGVWSGAGVVNPFAGVFNPANAGVGTHTISYTVTNANGCSTTETMNVTVNAGPDATIAAAGPFCGNAAAVQLSAATSGGTWSGTGVSASGMFDPVVAGAGNHMITYTVTSGSCTSTATRMFTVSTAVNVSASIKNETCAGNNDAVVDINVNGGNAPYTYAWSSGGTSQDLFNVGAGSYTVTVTDVNNCATTQSFTVTSSSAITAVTDSILPNTNPSNSHGAVYITVSGGTPPYEYVWSNGANTQDLINVRSDEFTLTIYDANGCSVTYTYVVPSLFGVGIDQNENIGKIVLYPNPTSGALTLDVDLLTTKEVTYEVLDVLGRVILSESLGSVDRFTEQMDLSDLSSGQYMLRMKVGDEIVNKKFIISK